MTNNAPDYYDNLAFPPEGDWADTSPRANTDRTGSTIALVNKIEELTKWVDLKSEYIAKLEEENSSLKALLLECQYWLLSQCPIQAKKVIDQIDNTYNKLGEQ